uniref:AlNc14C3G382 protein n=1 Tax=Albugo laibachii Nc14 TaxID=890382 RepID=F0VZQ3_9STRA|nr:AlNc14C3G382 [Albugo laibachii Nc14]|eukprot:CCA14274.1 AlNc14C3G382 [Albugo laibachii Nc14]
MSCDSERSYQSIDCNKLERYRIEEYNSGDNEEECEDTEALDMFEIFELRVGKNVLRAIQKTDEKLHGEEPSSDCAKCSEKKRQPASQYWDDSSRYERPADFSMWRLQFPYLRVRGIQVRFQEDTSRSDFGSPGCEFASGEETFAMDVADNAMDDDRTNKASKKSVYINNLAQ